MNPLVVLRDAVHFFSRHLLFIATLCLPLIVAECLVRTLVVHLLPAQHAPAYELVSALLFYPLYTGALILFLEARSQGQHPKRLPLLAASLQLWPRFAVLAALSTLAIMLAGSLFLPLALWLMVKLAFAEYLLMLRGANPMQAIRESFLLTVGHLWSLLACVLLVIVPLWLLEDWSLHLLGAQTDPIDGLLLDVINDFLQLFSSVVLFRCYMLCGPAHTEDSHSS